MIELREYALTSELALLVLHHLPHSSQSLFIFEQFFSMFEIDVIFKADFSLICAGFGERERESRKIKIFKLRSNFEREGRETVF